LRELSRRLFTLNLHNNFDAERLVSLVDTRQRLVQSGILRGITEIYRELVTSVCEPGQRLLRSSKAWQYCQQLQDESESGFSCPFIRLAPSDG